ncbi:MAG: nucleotidyltransferase domain-containing protein, partial [Planctomycetaceae bacterium]|nr:nucleotidyltransferase domain-containing protein [Planctomycetaceae bacterium]
MNDGLTERYRAELRSIFASCSKVERVLLFGSRAKGNFRRDSDVDFVLEGNDLVFSDLASLRGQFEESNVPYDIDILIRNKINNQSLENQINKYG